jgi:hypothetical protein
LHGSIVSKYIPIAITVEAKLAAAPNHPLSLREIRHAITQNHLSPRACLASFEPSSAPRG